MQKKYIIPVLMAVPTAMPMMADIVLPDMPNNDWTLSGISGDQSIIDGDQVTVKIGVGVVSQVLSLPTGQFTLKFASTENVKVKINDAVVNLTNEEYTFNVNAGANKTTNVTLAITGLDEATAFSFKGASLELDFDFAAAQDALTAAVGELYKNLNALPAVDDKSAAADELRKEAARIKEEWGTLRTKATNVVANQSLDFYTDNEFYKDVDGYTEDVIAKEIAALKADQEKYLENLAAENVLYQNYLDNQAFAATLATELDALKAMPGKCEAALGTDKDSYAYGKYNEAVAAYKTEVAKFIEKFNAAVKKREAVLTQEEKDGLKATIEELTDKGQDIINGIDGANADALAYAAYEKSLADFNKLATEAINKIDILGGVEGMGTNFAADQAAAREAVEKCKTETLGKCSIKTGEIDGAADKWKNNDKGVLEDGTDKINEIVANLTKLVTDQNKAYTDAMNTIGGEFGLQENLDELKTKAELLPEGDFKTNFENTVADLQTRIDALKDAVEKGYTNKNLNLDNIVLGDETTTFKAEADSILDTIKDLDLGFDKGGYYDTVITLNGALKEAWDAIGEANKAADFAFIVEKFQSTHDNIQTSINSLDPVKFANGDYSEKELAALKNSIAEMTANAKNLHDAVQLYLDGTKDAQKLINDLKAATINAEDLININDAYDVKAFENGTLKGIVDLLTGIETDYAAATGKDAQECYDAVKAVVDALSTADFAGKTQAALEEFRKGLSLSNSTEMENEWGDAQVYFQGQTCKVDLQPLMTTINNARNEYKAANDNAFLVDNYNIADEALNEAYEMTVRYVNSDKAYHSGDFAETVATITANLEDLREYNAKISHSPATEYYEGVIGAADATDKTSLQGRLTALEKAINEAHLSSNMLTKPAEGDYKTNADKFKAELEALTAEGAQLKLDIKANEDAHETELGWNQNVLQTIETALKTVQEYVNAGMSDEMITAIETIRDTKLNDLNREVAEAYATGKADTDKAPGDNLNKFIESYKAIESEVNGLLTDYSAAYSDYVKVLDTELLEQGAWPALSTRMQSVYTSSINTYNAYLLLENPGYKKAIADVLKTHADIYEYSTDIRELEAKVRAYVAAAIEANKIIENNLEVEGDPDNAQDVADIKVSWEAYALTPAKAIIEAMNAKVEALSAALNKVAVDYYATIQPAAADAINDAETAMRDAKIDEAIIEKALTTANDAYYNPAVDRYNDTDKNLTAPVTPVTETIGYVMDDIADDLDEVAGAIDIQAAAQADWTAVYGKALETITECEEILASCNAVTAEEIAEVQAAIDETKQNAAAIDTTAKADKDLISNLLGYKGDLAQLLSDIRTKVDDLKSANDANVAEQEAWDNYNDVVIPDLKSDYDAFLAFINMMACESSVDTQSIADAIAAVEKAVKDNKGNLVKNAATIKAAIDNAKDELTLGYNTAVAKEKAILAKQVEAVKVAFNNAKVSENCPDDIEQINETLDALFDEIKALQFDSEDAEAFKQSALGYETQLNNWLVKLQAYDPDHGNTLQATADALDKLVKDQAAAIAEGKAGVSDLVKEKYDREYDKLTEELNAVQSAIKAAGNNVITQAGNFEADIKAIGDKLTELNAEAKEAGDKAEADKARQEINDANFADLTELIKTLNSDLEDLKAAIENYGYSEESYYQGRIEVITNTIAQLQQEIDEQNEAIGLNEAVATNLKDQGNTIANAINALEVEAATRYTNAAKANAEQAIANALAALEPGDGKFVVPAMAQEAQSTIESLKWMFIEYDGRFTNWLDKWSNRNDAVASELNDYADAFKEIAEAAASVKATAEENTFRYGDVNEDNEVDVLDVQQVLNWVMSLQEIDELSPRVGAAADVNKDGLLNIADVTAIINMAMGENESQVRAAMGRRMVESNNTIYPELVSAENGVRRFAISLANSEVFANGQFDLKLAPGMMIESVTIGERVKGHEVLSQDHGDITRVAVVSMENAAIQGTDGAVVYVEVSGEGNIAIENAVFATPKAVGHVISNGETSAIDKVIEGARDLKERIYNAAGQQLDRVQRGINIIRKSDGTVTKELRK